MSEQKKPGGSQFNILKNDSTDGHGGFGVGALSLENVTPVIIDPEDKEAFIDMGALHARSKVERRLKFVQDRAEVPNGRLYWIVWVTVAKGPEGTYYAGLGGCEIRVNREIKRGYKSMPEHVNNMDKSMKHKVAVEHMDQDSRALLATFLEGYDLGMWERSPSEIQDALKS
ncbi:YwhD family protein [Aureibacillus halotolerans]|uniref:YwhD-like protein n=1 Tax=Aureibacillus halotolerans TaxID=1508390 RepID=A0A4R6TXY6_9BACI|nr:YwhD family protein [Aureibacillus halotolerans]TDQ38770.1 YwhD-like protein [Aureibacillus halotolerans]